MKPESRIAVVYQGLRDQWGNISQTRLWLVLDGFRAPGYTLRGQVFRCAPLDAREYPGEVRHFHVAIAHGIGGTHVQGGEREARAWLLRGVTLTPTCKRCGMGEARHVAPHAFEPEVLA